MFLGCVGIAKCSLLVLHVVCVACFALMIVFPLHLWLDGFYQLQRPRSNPNITVQTRPNIYQMSNVPTPPPYVPDVADFSPQLLDFLPNNEQKTLLYPIMPILLQSKLILTGVSVASLAVVVISYFFICFELRVVSAMVSVVRYVTYPR